MRTLLFVSITIGLSGPPALAFDLEIAVASQVHDLKSGEKVEVEANKKLTVTDKNPLWITSAGRVPVLVVPLNAGGSLVKVDSPRAEIVFKEEKELRIDGALSEVTLHLSEINRHIATRELALANQKLTELKGKYPEMRFLNFIEASVAFLSGDRDRALAMVNLGLSAHPNYQPGLDLKKKIQGGN